MMDDEDQDALAAEWEASMAGDDGGGDDGGDPEDGDALAAEWESMVSGGDDGDDDGLDSAVMATSTGREATRVLDQSEIDSLLGFDDDHAESGEQSGIQAILNSALVSYERLPMLEVVFDRLVRMMSTSLRNFTSDNVEV